MGTFNVPGDRFDMAPETARLTAFSIVVVTAVWLSWWIHEATLLMDSDSLWASLKLVNTLRRSLTDMLGVASWICDRNLAISPITLLVVDSARCLGICTEGDTSEKSGTRKESCIVFISHGVNHWFISL